MKFLFFSMLLSGVLSPAFSQVSDANKGRSPGVLGFSIGYGSYTDFSNFSFGHVDGLGIPAFTSSNFALKTNYILSATRYEHLFSLHSSFSRAINFDGGEGSDRTLNRDRSSLTHLALNYTFSRYFFKQNERHLRLGLIIAGLLEKKELSYVSVGQSEKSGMSLGGGVFVSYSDRIHKNLDVVVSLENIYFHDELNKSQFSSEDFSINFGERFVNSNFDAAVIYNFTDSRSIEVMYRKEEYRNISLSQKITLPKKDRDATIFFVTYKNKITIF